jgi:hypothetical protein
VARRVLALLAGITQTQIEVPADSITIAEELSPSDIASHRSKVLGFCTTTGGATSHAAILARSPSIPYWIRAPHAFEKKCFAAGLSRPSAAGCQARRRAGPLRATAAKAHRAGSHTFRPDASWCRFATRLDPMSKEGVELVAPAPDRLICGRDATLEQQFLNVAQAQPKPSVTSEPRS